MAIETQQYIISFLAEMKGDQLVLKQIKGLDVATSQIALTTGKASQATKDWNQKLSDIVKRAALTIPTWFILRNTFMGIVRVIGDVIKANVQFEDEMARIKTVVASSSTTIAADMIVIKSVILDMATKTSLSINELAEGFYYLRTANLSTEEAIAAFGPSVDSAVGSQNSLKDTARAVAVVYNTMGKTLGDNLTINQKFTKIADTLSYVYAVQDVQLNELTASYRNLAPHIKGVSDDFSELTMLLGILNTLGLKAGKTGTSLGQTIRRLSTNAKDLKAIFGIAFDPKQPINLLGTLEQISKKIQQTGRVTTEQAQALNKVFEIRGGLAPKLLVPDFENVLKQINAMREGMAGYSAAMKNVRENTISNQLKIMSNVIGVLTNDFISGVYGAGVFSDALKLINGSLVDNRDEMEAWGNMIGWLMTNLSNMAIAAERAFEIEPKLAIPVWGGIETLIHRKELTKLNKELEQQGIKFIGIDEYIIKLEETRTRILNQRAKDKVTATKADADSLKNEEIRLTALKEEEDQLKTHLEILKSIGVTETALLRAKIQGIRELETRGITSEEAKVRILQTQNDLMLEQVNIVAKHTNMVNNLILKYAQSDEEERKRIRRFSELRQLSPTELKMVFSGGGQRAEDTRKVLLDFIDNFSEVQQKAILGAAANFYKFPKELTKLPKDIKDSLEETMKELPTEGITSFWETFKNQGKDALTSLFGVEGNLKSLFAMNKFFTEVVPIGPTATTPANSITERLTQKTVEKTTQKTNMDEIVKFVNEQGQETLSRLNELYSKILKDLINKIATESTSKEHLTILKSISDKL